MDELVITTVIGLSLGSIYAIASTGLVVTYATSGIFNFAHGAVGMFAAFLYWQFRWGWNWPAPLATIMVVVVICPIFGILLERFVIRGLRNTMEITKIVVPISLLLLLTGGAAWIWGGTEPETMRRFWGNARIAVGEVFISWHNIIVLIVSVVLAAVLLVILYLTRLGVTMRAVVDNPELTQLNGARPNRASAMSWAIGSSLAGIAGVLLSSLQSSAINIFVLTLIVVNAYAAAIFGRLRSLTLTFVGSIVIGLAVSYWNWISEVGSKWSWLSGFRVSIPVVLLFVVLLILPHERLRGAVVSRVKERFAVPTLSRSLIWAVGIVVFFLAAVPLIQGSPTLLLSRGLAFGIISLSLVLLTGYAGEINLAPLTFAGIGAIVAQQFDVGLTTSARTDFSLVGIIFLAIVGAVVGWAIGLLFRKAYGRIAVFVSTAVFAVLGVVSALWLEGEASGIVTRERLSLTGILVVAVVCALIGAIIALPALRLRGLYLGLATFAFAVFMTNMVFKQRSTLQLNIPWVGDGEDFGINLFTGGGVFVPRPSWLGIDFKESSKAYMVLLAVVFAVIGLGLVLLRRSAFGRQLAAMKDSPAACATLGLSIVRLKLSVFALSSAIAGVGGVLYVGVVGTANEDNFFIFASLPIVLLLVVAGIGYVSGAFAGGILAGVFFVMMSDVFGKLSTDYSSFEWLFNDVIKNFFFFVGPAFAAITLASNPGGFLNDMFDNYRPLATRKGLPLLGVWVVLQGLFYWFVNLQWVGMWTFMLISLGVALLLPVIARAIMPSLYVDEETLLKRKTAVPPELVGTDGDFTSEEVAEMNTALNMPAEVMDADRAIGADRGAE